MADTHLRTATIEDLPNLHSLCMQSKAYWGYDDDFMDKCSEELRITPKHLETDLVMITESNQTTSGVVQLTFSGTEATLDKLFIAPDAIGKGIGKLLFNWATETAQKNGASKLIIHADPYAEAFYKKVGAKTVSTTPSGSIEGRMLPLMEYSL